MQPTGSTHAVPGLDAVRFATALLVMFFHLCYWRNGRVATDVLGSMWWFGWVGVEIFFTISGFVIAFSAAGVTPRKYALSRAVRLAPMIWMCATIALLANLVILPTPPSDLANSYVSTLFLRPFGPHIDVVYWTLTVELAFYIFVFIAIRTLGFQWMIRLLIGIGMLSALFNIALVLPLGETRVHRLLLLIASKQTFRLLLVKHGCFFALGALLFNRRSTGASQTLFVCVCLVGATAEVWSQAIDHAQRVNQLRFSLYVAPLAWLIGYAGIYLSSEPAINARLQQRRSILRTLGLLTFPVYLLHNNIGIMSRDWLVVRGASNLLATSIAMAAVLLLAYGLSRHMDPIVSAAFRRAIQRINGRLTRADNVVGRTWNYVFRSPAHSSPR